jgi:hypothetical protein
MAWTVARTVTDGTDTIIASDHNQLVANFAVLGGSDGNTKSGAYSIGGVLTVTAGSEAAPSIVPSGDANNGIWFPAADTIAVSTAGTERMRITSAGYVGIGTTNPDVNYGLTVQAPILSRAVNADVAAISTAGHSYFVNGTVTGYNAYYCWRYNGTDKWVLHCDSGANLFLTDADGDNGVYISQNQTAWSANSDSRIKDVKETIANALDKVNQLTGVKFTWKRDADNPDAKTRVGLIAQDVLAVLPEAVDNDTPDLITDEETGKVSGGLGVRYTELIPLLVNAIKELSQRVEALEA